MMAAPLFAVFDDDDVVDDEVAVVMCGLGGKRSGDTSDQASHFKTSLSGFLIFPVPMSQCPPIHHFNEPLKTCDCRR